MSDKLPAFTKVFCGDNSPLGYIADALAVGAKDCWCCSFWRGMIVGGAVGFSVGVATAILALAL